MIYVITDGEYSDYGIVDLVEGLEMDNFAEWCYKIYKEEYDNNNHPANKWNIKLEEYEKTLGIRRGDDKYYNNENWSKILKWRGENPMPEFPNKKEFVDLILPKYGYNRVKNYELAHI